MAVKGSGRFRQCDRPYHNGLFQRQLRREPSRFPSAEANEGTITGVELLEISDTPGLGMKATEPAFKDQYKDKTVEEFTVTKTGSASDSEINAISGATITSNAVTNAVNAALYYLHNCIPQ